MSILILNPLFKQSIKRLNYHFAVFKIYIHYYLWNGRNVEHFSVFTFNMINVVCTGFGYIGNFAVNFLSVLVNDSKTYKILYKIAAFLKLNIVSVHIKHAVSYSLSLFHRVNSFNFHNNNIFCHTGFNNVYRRAAFVIQGVKFTKKFR